MKSHHIGYTERSEGHVEMRFGTRPHRETIRPDNIHERVLPISEQNKTGTSRCVRCGHTHWDRYQLLYLPCAICKCENVGR